MKTYYFYLAAIAALASCSSDDFLGTQSPDLQTGNGEITFVGAKPNMTRGDHVGADAADLLGNNFVVAGYKGSTIGTPASVVTGVVFDHYNVGWTENTAGTTASNTSDWEYVGKDKSKWNTSGGAQSIKYWDYSAGQYDFIAFSTGKLDAANVKKMDNTFPAAGSLAVSAVTPSTATSSTGGAYKVQGDATALGKFYIADLVTAYNPANTPAPTVVMGKEVQLKFRNIASKVRVGLYETVPGYSIKDVEFYASDNAALRYVKENNVSTKTVLAGEYFEQDGTTNSYHAGDDYDNNTTYYDNTGAAVNDVQTKEVLTKLYYNNNGSATYDVDADYNAQTDYYNRESDVTNLFTLYSQSANIYTDGTYTVYYPTVDDASKSDYNKAHVSFEATKDASDNVTGATTTSTYAALNYANSKNITGSDVNYLGETSNDATYCTTSPAKDYFTVLPNETATALTLRVNYTLVSNDGSKETIKVWGAKAVVPSQYTAWKSNYAYTYLFKISDKTNGKTQGLGQGPEGLTPITFDAVVVDSEDGMQETVTTVATPSITTYMKEAPNVTDNDEYPAGTIYVMVQDGATIKKLTTDGKLYRITSASANVPVTEANVMDALNMGEEDDDTKVVTGRNSLVLTPQNSDAAITAIPGVDGNDISVTAGDAAKFTATAGTTYAYVYKVSDAADTEYYTAVTIAKDADAKGYYTLEDVNGVKTYTEVTTSTIVGEDGGKIYYQKLTNNNTTYAVKVIKVVA